MSIAACIWHRTPWPSPLAPNAMQGETTTAHRSRSQAVPLPASTQKPRQAIQNKACVSLTTSGSVRGFCMCVCATLLSSCDCMGRRICAGLFVFVQACSLVFRPHPQDPQPSASCMHSGQPGPRPCCWCNAHRLSVYRDTHRHSCTDSSCHTSIILKYPLQFHVCHSDSTWCSGASHVKM